MSTHRVTKTLNIVRKLDKLFDRIAYRKKHLKSSL